LKVLRISNGNPTNKAIWLDGGIHAREWISPATVTYIVNQFVEQWEDQPKFIQNIDWYVLPVVNPDGYEYTHEVDRLWRKNRGGAGSGRCAGVDLNRNFGYKWGGQGASRQPCAETFAGATAFSEPETKALQDFMTTSAADFKAYVTFHSYGQYILYPWGYDRTVPPDHKELDKVGKDAAEKIQKLNGTPYTVGPSGSLLYPASGASDDWAKGALGIKFSYTVELRDSGRYGFILPAHLIEPTAEEAIVFVETVAKAVADLK
jgi:murein tripeptide amidase MpaA